MRVQLTFTVNAREEAIYMRSLRNIETPECYEGPLFENAYAMIEGGFLRIETYATQVAASVKGTILGRAPEATYYYKLENIARYKVY